MSTSEELHRALRRTLADHPQIGCYQIVKWTSDKAGEGCLKRFVPESGISATSEERAGRTQPLL